MKEFISILISFLFMGIADSIDSAFNHAISIDAIVVCGSLFSIELILKSISEIGTYTYRVIRKDECSCLIVNIFIGLILGIIVFFSRNIIVDIFSLTNYQKNLLSNVLALYIGYLVIGRLSNAIFEMVRLKGNLKLYRKSLFIFYIALIALDYLAFVFTKDLIILFVATMISWIISIVYMLYNLKLKFKFPDKKLLDNVLKYGIPLALERLLSRIFILIYGVIASYLGTDKYSIHSVCYAVCLNLEIITNAYQAALMIKVPEANTYEKQYKNCMKMRNKCFGLIVGLNFIFAIIYLLISHGSLPLDKCFPYILFYALAVFGLYPYETYKTLCIVQGKPFILLFGSIVGVFVRVLICLLCMKTEFALFIFAISNFIDFYIRSRIYKLELKTSIA